MPAKEHVIKSDLNRIDELRDDDIDYSDIPELGDDMFAKPLAPWPPKKETITIRVDSDVLGETGQPAGPSSFISRKIAANCGSERSVRNSEKWSAWRMKVGSRS
jgi:hypothetical protein